MQSVRMGKMRVTVLVICICLPTAIVSCPCPPNEICLRNQTCHCPFFKLGDVCMPRRFQTTVNTTIESLYAARHLLASATLLTIDSTNYEAMQALSATLAGVANVGNVVTSVIDSVDTLIGGEPSATMEIADLAFSGQTRVLVTVEYRLPATDFFYFYMHFGTSTPPCPPFDIIDSCCRGVMGSEFVTVGVDCSADPMRQMKTFVANWGGWFPGVNQFTVPVDLSRTPVDVDGTHRFGIGMVVFGRLAQNTESRVEIQVKPSVTVASSGFFQFSFVENVHLQLEAYDTLLFARMIIKAAGVASVGSLRYASSENGNFTLPNCTERYSACGQVTVGCTVTVDAEFVELVVPLPTLTQTTLVYALLSKNYAFTRVLARTDGTVLQHCRPVISVNAQLKDSFSLEVLQRGQTIYEGPVQFVNLTDVALLTLRLHSFVNNTVYRFDNVSVVYSLVNVDRIARLMPKNRVTPELEALCDNGKVCIIETLLLNGVCQTSTKCEWQGGDLVVMPLYPWKGVTLQNGAYTVMICEITNEALAAPAPRRMMGWFGRFFR